MLTEEVITKGIFSYNVLAGIIANVVFALILIFGGGFAIWRRNKRLLRFWHIKDIARLRVYLSSLWIPFETSKDGPHGNTRTFEGWAIPASENQMVEPIRNLFYSAITEQRQFEDLFAGMMKAHAAIEVLSSPASTSEIVSNGTILTIGSPGYNVVSAEVERQCDGKVGFCDNNRAISLPKNDPVPTGQVNAIIVRKVSNGRCWFYAAGPRTIDTIAAVLYLTNSWKKMEPLLKRSDSFYVALEVSGQDHAHPRVVAQNVL
jgi:hypothetical protein